MRNYCFIAKFASCEANLYVSSKFKSIEKSYESFRVTTVIDCGSKNGIFFSSFYKNYFQHIFKVTNIR